MKRLARTLAAATGGIGGPERPSSGFATPKPFASMTTGAGDAAVVVDRPEEGDRDNQAPTRAATTDASGWYPRTTPPASQVPEPLATGGGGRRVVEALQSSSNENNAWSLARRKGGEGDQPKQPSLAWEATIGAAIRESWGTSGKVQRRDMPRDTQFIPRSTNVVDDLRVGLAAFSPPVAATHGGSPRRRKGTSSPRTVRQGSPREGRSPDLWSAYSGKISQRVISAVMKHEEPSLLDRFRGPGTHVKRTTCPCRHGIICHPSCSGAGGLARNNHQWVVASPLEYRIARPRYEITACTA